MKKEVTSFGARLSSLHKAAGFTQIELAAELGVSQRMVAYYESPAATPPANLLPQIAAASGVTIDELFGVGATRRRVKQDGDSRLRRRLLAMPVSVPRGVVGDADDDHVIAAAVASRAELIVTGDRAHLLPIGTHQGIAIVTAREVVDRIEARSKA